MNKFLVRLFGLIAMVCTIAVLAPVAEAGSDDDRVKTVFLRSGVHSRDVTFLSNRLTSLAMENGAYVHNETNNTMTWVENSEDLTLAFGTNLLTFDTTTAATLLFEPGVRFSSITITGALTLDTDDCGKTLYVTAGIDTATITLPATVDGCEYRVVYTGADGGALLDISPAAADAIHGSCTLAASVLEFNGTDDNDVGLTKTTANTSDTITLLGDGSAGWYTQSCTGIWANN